MVGGGRVAERKARGLLDCQAKVHVISPALSDGLAKMHKDGILTWSARGYEKGDVKGAFLVMAATDDPVTQDTVLADAATHNILLNVADVPEKCNFILPARVKRGALSISISTSGKSPALAKQLRKELEAAFGREYEIINDIMGLMRPEVLGQGLAQKENEQIFLRFLDAEMLEWVRDQKYLKIIGHFEKHLGRSIESALASQIKLLVLS